MNFFETHPKGQRVSALVVIKFSDNIHFSLDGDSIREQVRGIFEGDDTNVLTGRGEIREIETGIKHPEKFSLFFRGFFRQTLEGKLLIHDGIHPKMFDKYKTKVPYLLSFYYDTFERKNLGAHK